MHKSIRVSWGPSAHAIRTPSPYICKCILHAFMSFQILNSSFHRFLLTGICWSFSFFVVVSSDVKTASLCVFSLADQASRSAAGPIVQPETRGVCGCYRQPLFPPEHRYHGDRQHHSARRQRAGPTQLRHGVHPDGRHHKCALTKLHAQAFLLFKTPNINLGSFWFAVRQLRRTSSKSGEPLFIHQRRSARLG